MKKPRESIEALLKKTAKKPFKVIDFKGSTLKDFDLYLYRSGIEVEQRESAPDASTYTYESKELPQKVSLPRDVKSTIQKDKHAHHQGPLPSKDIIEADNKNTDKIIEAIKNIEISMPSPDTVEIRSRGKTIIVQEIVRDSRGFLGAGTRIRVEEDE